PGGPAGLRPGDLEDRRRRVQRRQAARDRTTEVTPGASVAGGVTPAAVTPRLAVLCAIFFLSGQAALVLETLWFREAGLTFGNTVWAAAIVTASFMAGLAAGSAAVARHGRRLGRPLLAYAGLEALIGVSGLLLVLAFPRLTPALMPLFRRWIAAPAA